MKILVADTAPLYPAYWGGPKRIWNLYKYFSNEILYVGSDCRLNGKHNVKKLKDNFTEISVPISKLYFPIRFIEMQFFKDLTFDLFTYLCMAWDLRFKKVIRKQKANVLIASHPWTFSCFNRRNQILVYDAHNCEYELMKQIIGPGFVANAVRRLEKKACDKSDIIVVCSEKDKESFRKLYTVPESKFFYAPNAATASVLKPKIKSKSIFFVGAFYRPNIEAARFILKLAKDMPDYRFKIAGTVNLGFVNEIVPKNVEFLGRLSDSELEKEIDSSYIAINPMIMGSGINIKMLDFMAKGLPIVTTEIGARGIKQGEHFIVSILEDFKKNIERLYNDDKLYSRLRKNANNLVKENYDWEEVSKSLENHLLLYNKAREHFSSVSKTYLEDQSKGLWGTLKRKERDVVMSLVNGNGRALDLGSGAGYYAIELRKKGYDVDCLDYSNEMVYRAKENGFNAFVGDMANFKPQSKYDLVLCGGSLEFNSDIKSIFKNVRSMLRDNGEFVILFPVKSLLSKLYRRYHRRKGLVVNLFTLEQIKKLLELNGFKLLNVRKVGFNNVVRARVV